MYRHPKTVVEFVQRTRAVVGQYDQLESTLGADFYNVTLLLNCLLGLVVLPRENRLNAIQDGDIPESIRHTLANAVNNRNEKISVTFSDYIIGLRNAIVHWGQSQSLKFLQNDQGQIARVCLEGTISRNTRTLRYVFSLENGNELTNVIEAILDHVYGINNVTV